MERNWEGFMKQVVLELSTDVYVSIQGETAEQIARGGNVMNKGLNIGMS